MVWSLESDKAGSWEKTSRQYRCEPIFADRGEESALGFQLLQLHSVEHWKVGLWDCSGISHAFALTGAKGMQMTQQRWEWEQSASIYLEGVVSGIAQSSESMRQSKSSEFPSRGFRSPSHSSPVLFSESIISEFQIPNFGIYDSKLRNSEWILGVQLCPGTSEPKYSASGSKLWEQRWHACFFLHAQQRKVGREACVWWIGGFLCALQDLNAAGTQCLFHKHCAYEAWHIGASNNKSKRPIQGTLQIQVTICALPKNVVKRELPGHEEKQNNKNRAFAITPRSARILESTPPLRAQDWKISRSWNFQARLKIPSEPPTKPLSFVGNSEGQDWNFQARLKFSSGI